MEYKKVKRVGNNQAGFTFEVEVPTDTAEMTNGANFQNAEQVQQAIAQSSGGLVIETETTTTVKGFAVPVLTAEQVVSIYNAVASGKAVTITDPSGNYHFNIDQADNVSGDISVEYKFFNTMYVTYTLVDDTVTVTGELIGGKRYLHQFVFRKSSSTQPEFAYFSIENNSQTLMGKSGISSWLYNKGCVSEATAYRKDISYTKGSDWFSRLDLPIDVCIYSSNGSDIILRYHPTQITMNIESQPNKFKVEYSTGNTLNKSLNETAYTLTETVIEL